MAAQDPATCCFLVSTRDHPITLHDAFTGKVRCSYSATDHLDQIVAPNCLAFNLDGSKLVFRLKDAFWILSLTHPALCVVRIYCGFDNAIRIFDTLTPGRDFDLLSTTPSRRSREGQKGLISCIAFNPDRSGLYAAGSFSKTIGLYDEKQENVLFTLKGHTGGLTHVVTLFPFPSISFFSFFHAGFH